MYAYTVYWINQNAGCLQNVIFSGSYTVHGKSIVLECVILIIKYNIV